MAAIVLTVASMTSQTVTGYQYWFDNDTLSKQSEEVTSDKLTLEPDLSGMPYGIHFFNLRLHDSDGVWGAPYRKSFLTVDSRSGVVAYEYWFDNDYDKKVAEKITTEGAVFNVDLSGQPHGLHFFNLRLRTNSNEYGSIYRKVFFTAPTQTSAVAYEYWIDNNYDGKTEGAVTDGDNVYAVSLEGLKKGIHRFSYRMKTAEGEWGSVYTRLFHYTSSVTFTDYEYWLDNDYAHKVSGKDTSGMTSFAVDLDSLPQNEIHHFNMRVRDDNGEWGSVYRKLLVLYNDSAKVPVKGYRHYLNGRDLGYVPVDNNPDGKYTFVIDVPEGEGFDMSDVPVTFDGDSLSVSHTSAFDYKIQMDSETGASPAWAYSFDSEVNYGTSARLVDVPSSFNITRPSRTEFRAIKFNTDGRTLYVRATRKATLDIYKDGEKLTTVPADSIIGTQALTLAEGTYFGVIYNVADGEGNITFHLTIDRKKLPTPTAEYGRHLLTLDCADKQAQILYATDSTIGIEDFVVYESPIQLVSDCTVRFYATRTTFEDSEINSFEFTLSDYQEPLAQTTKDFRNRKITVEAGECKLAVTINGSTVEYRSPVTIDVTPDMAAVSVVTLARNEDRYDSDPVEEQLVFHPAPVIGYDGPALDVIADENDPSANPEIKVTFNDKPVGADSPMDGFGEVTAHVESDEAFRSEETTMAIDHFNTGSKAGARNGHRLSEAFAEWNAGEGYPELTVVGDINREDLTFLSGMEELATLHLMPDSMADEPYGRALENSRIETVTLKEAPGGLLDGMPRLTGVVWRDSDTPVPDGFAGAQVNPNLLLWVSDRKLAPGDVRNVVTYTAAGEGLPSGMTGHADDMTLTSGYPYGAYRPVEVNHIEFCKQFNQTTEKGVCRGWETIVLPFVPDEIRHRDKGPVIPYERWETEYGSGVYGDEGPKPFWIYEAAEDGWNPVEEMESGKPYIISMPDNPEYIESYNLAGEVVFSADGVILGVETEEPFPHSSEWAGGLTFTATFMPVDGSHRSLNDEWDEAIGDVLPGSVFTPDAETLPFEAYVTGPGPRDIPVSGGGSGITLPALPGYGGISVEAIGGGCIRIVSRHACSVDIHTPTGAKIRSVDLTPEESVTVRDLTPGIYIIAGRKVVVR